MFGASFWHLSQARINRTACPTRPVRRTERVLVASDARGNVIPVASDACVNVIPVASYGGNARGNVILVASDARGNVIPDATDAGGACE